MSVTKTVERRDVVVRKYTCDRCGKDAAGRTCVMCGRDLCHACIAWDPHCYGDYQDAFCKECWKMGEPHRVTIEELDAEQDECREAWKAACVESRRAEEGE